MMMCPATMTMFEPSSSDRRGVWAKTQFLARSSSITSTDVGDTARALHKEAQERGVHFVDDPVRGQSGAKAGQSP